MPYTKLFALLVSLLGGTHALECYPGGKHKAAAQLADSYCYGDGWSFAGLEHCQDYCCEDDELKCGGQSDEEVGSPGQVTEALCAANKADTYPLVAFTHRRRSASLSSEPDITLDMQVTLATTSFNKATTNGSESTDCCAPSLTCADVDSAFCAVNGYTLKAVTTPATSCTGLSKYQSCGSACCANDATKCGSASGSALDTACATATLYRATGGERTAAWNIKSATTIANCCMTRAPCSAYTCPAGYKDSTTKATTKCSGNAATCNFAVCCIVDTTKCGGVVTACTGLKYKDTTKSATVFTTFATDCCTDQKKCTAVTCADGYKKAAATVIDCTSDTGDASACTTSTCCITDVLTCGGMYDIYCVLPLFNYGPSWSNTMASYPNWIKSNPTHPDLAAKKKGLASATAKYSAWAKQATTMAKKNKAATEGGCCTAADKCSDFKAYAAPTPAPSAKATAKTVTGSFTLQVSDPAAFTGAKLAEVKTAFAAAIAETLGADITAAMVTVTAITAVAARRLDAMDNDRRLAAGDVKVEYTIALPATYTGAAITKDSFAPATLKAKLVAEVAKIEGFTATVTGTPVVAAVTTADVVTTTAKDTGLINGTPNFQPGCLSLFVGLSAIFALFSK